MKVCAVELAVNVSEVGLKVPPPAPADNVIVSVTVDAGVSVKLVDATPVDPEVGPVSV